jgi:hypothetical protein
MDENSDRFENFLREFRPRHPRALPAATAQGTTSVRPATRSRSRRIAAAAALAIALGSSTWFVLRTKFPRRTAESPAFQPVAIAQPERVAPFALRQLALSDPHQLDIALTQASRSSLCDVRDTTRALHALANE